MRAPRFDGCRHCVERLIASPASELLPERVSPELRHLQAELAAQLPYRQAAALLEELFPETGGLNYATTRNRTLAVGKRIEEEIRGKIDHPRVVPEPAERMVVGIDGAFVKAGHTRPGQRHQFEILTGRVEAPQAGRRGIRCGAGPGSVCKEEGTSHSPALRSRTRHGFEDPVGW